MFFGLFCIHVQVFAIFDIYDIYDIKVYTYDYQNWLQQHTDQTWYFMTILIGYIDLYHLINVSKSKYQMHIHRLIWYQIREILPLYVIINWYMKPRISQSDYQIDIHRFCWYQIWEILPLYVIIIWYMKTHISQFDYHMYI